MNILLIDDDKEFLDRLHKDLFVYFSEYYSKVNIYSYSSHFLSIDCSVNYDYAFIDIDLCEFNGIDMAKNIKTKNPRVNINFVSAHTSLVHDSLIVRPFYFIRKANYRIDLQRFFDLANKQVILKEAIGLNYKGVKTRVFTDEIICIEAQLHKLTIKTNNGEYFDNRSLKEIESLLPKNSFIRIHKSYIVNLDYLISYKKSLIFLVNNIDITIGRIYKKDFEIFYRKFLLK